MRAVWSCGDYIGIVWGCVGTWWGIDRDIYVFGI